MTEQVPWDEWADITRLGGEVAEWKEVSHTPKRKKPGPKPKIEGVMEAVREHLLSREMERAHERRADHRAPVINYVAKPKRKSAGKKGRGRLR